MARPAASCRRFGALVDDAILRVGLVFPEPRIEDVQRGTIGAKDLPIRAHVQIDVRMIVRCTGAHALQFLDADKYLLGTLIVGEVGYEMSGHGVGVPDMRW